MALSHREMDPVKLSVNMTFAEKVRPFKTTPLPEHTGMVVPATVKGSQITVVVRPGVLSNAGDERKKKSV